MADVYTATVDTQAAREQMWLGLVLFVIFAWVSGPVGAV